jgi:arsenate reductase
MDTHLPVLNQVKSLPISADRLRLLHSIATEITTLLQANKKVNLQFVCTHNSRRSQFSQIWAHAFCHYFNLHTVHCFSAGTEATALFAKVAETLACQGMQVSKLTSDNNPFYLIKPFEDSQPLFCFSKTLFLPEISLFCSFRSTPYIMDFVKPFMIYYHFHIFYRFV